VKNVTITLDEETARWARLEAAQREVSVSRLVRDILRENMRQNRTYEAAMASYLSRAGRALSEPGAPYPGREDVHDRAGLR
jgi:plasmid stability protein